MNEFRNSVTLKGFGLVMGAMVLAACSAPASSSDSASTGESDGMLLAGNKLTETEVASLLASAGFTSDQIPKMVCTAKYESAFYDRASNHNSNGSTDYGLFQINSIHVGKGGCTATASSLYDTTTNTSCAKQIFDEQGNNAWYGYQKHKAECDSYVISGSAPSSSGSSGSSGSGSSGGGSSGSGSTSGSGTSDAGDVDPYGSGDGSGSSSSSDSCWSATLDQEMPQYACVNSAFDPGEYQCIGGQWYGGVENGSGPAGSCNGEY